MKKTYFRKVLFLLVPVALLLILFILLHPTRKGYDLPVKYQFSTSTETISFVILDDYELYHISSDSGFLDTSQIDKTSKEFDFNVGEMQIGQQEIITVSCKRKNKEDPSLNSVSYMILVQSDRELIIETYKNDILIADDSFSI